MIEIGVIRTPFKEKFGIPKQSGLVNSVEGQIILDSSFSEMSVRGLNDFSHIWIYWKFHQAQFSSDSIRPPRLGGQKKIGVFACRSPHRPSLLAASVCKIKKIEDEKRPIKILVSGVDMLDKTPVFDIKPYIPRYDSISEATNGWLDDNPIGGPENVEFKPDISYHPEFEKVKDIVFELLRQDPRPRSQSQKTDFGMRYDHWNICYRWCDNKVIVTSVQRVD